jgi:hypothetical protein
VHVPALHAGASGPARHARSAMTRLAAFTSFVIHPRKDSLCTDPSCALRAAWQPSLL